MEIFSFQFLFLFLIPLLILRLYRGKKYNTKGGGFRSYPLVGSLPDFLINRNNFLDWTTQVLADCPTNTATVHRPGNVHGVITANPLNVEHMLKTNFDNYPKGERFMSFFHDFLGQGIFNSDGDSWKKQRKTASYEFNTKSLRNFIMDNVETETSTRLIPLLINHSQTEQSLDLQDVLERFAFDNICKLAFNVDPACLGGDAGSGSGSDFMSAFGDASLLVSYRFMYVAPVIWKIKKLFNLGTERKLKESITMVHKFADDIIRSRLIAERNNDQDLLSRFIGTDMSSPQFLRDIVISFILAGRDTTPSALTWFFWQLSLSPNVEQNILKELGTIRTRNGKKPGDAFTFEELREMHYLHAAISEALRLYPPIAVDTKTCKQDDILPDGTFVGKGWFLTYNTYAMARMESVWGENCQLFLPERWLENGVCRHESPYRFPVFHAGPRMCLGKEMAYIQMKSLAATIIERFAVEIPKNNTRPEQILSVAIRMKGGLHVKVKERCADHEFS